MTEEQWAAFGSDMFTGFDTDPTMLRISAMNLMLHSISNPRISYQDSVSKQNEIEGEFTICLANPPFKGTIDAEIISDNLKAVTNTKKTELLFVALFLRMLRNGGRCACIVPDGVLFGSSKAHVAIRKELVENHMLQAVISMPSGVSSRKKESHFELQILLVLNKLSRDVASYIVIDTTHGIGRCRFLLFAITVRRCIPRGYIFQR